MQTQLLVPAEVLRAHLPRELIVDYDLCPDCFEPLIELPTGVKICRKCGGEYNDGAQIEFDRIPMPEREEKEKQYFEGSSNPVNALAFHKNLGTQHLIPVKAICKILSRKGQDNTDLGLRAKLVKLTVERTEPEALHKALEMASQKLKLLNFGEDLRIGDSCGKIIRKAYAYLVIAHKAGFNSRTLSDACVYFTLRKFGYAPEPAEKVEGGWVRTNILAFPTWLLDVLQFLDTRNF